MGNTKEWSDMTKFEKLTFIYGILAVISSLCLMQYGFILLKKYGPEEFLLSLDSRFYSFLVITILLFATAKWASVRAKQGK